MFVVCFWDRRVLGLISFQIFVDFLVVNRNLGKKGEKKQKESENRSVEERFDLLCCQLLLLVIIDAVGCWQSHERKKRNEKKGEKKNEGRKSMESAKKNTFIDSAVKQLMTE